MYGFSVKKNGRGKRIRRPFQGLCSEQEYFHEPKRKIDEIKKRAQGKKEKKLQKSNTPSHEAWAGAVRSRKRKLRQKKRTGKRGGKTRGVITL